MHATLAIDNMPADTPDDQILTVDLGRSFEEFYRAEYPALIGVARAFVGVANGEDLVQDTMVRSLARWGTVQRLDRPGGWAHRVLLNACTSWFRRRRTEERFFARLRREEPATAGPSEEAVALWAATRQLPDRYRTVIALHYAGDRSVAEVADILGIPEGTVRSDLTRARAALARVIGDRS